MLDDTETENPEDDTTENPNDSIETLPYVEEEPWEPTTTNKPCRIRKQNQRYFSGEWETTSRNICVDPGVTPVAKDATAAKHK